MTNEYPDNCTILITGVAGLLGYNFATWLLNHTGHKVIGIDAMYDWGNHNKVSPNERYEFHRLDLVKHYEELDDIVKQNDVKIIYHFASYAAEGLSPFMRRFNYMQNTIASANIINVACKHGCRLIFTSSMSIYGRGCGEYYPYNFKETDRPAPIDPYAIAKYGVEQDLSAAAEQHGLKWVIIRPHNVFGIGQNVNDKYRNVIGIWMHQAVAGEPITIYGDGQQERAFTYIDNILEPLYTVIDPLYDYEVINLGGTRGMTINEAYDVVRKVTGYDNVIYLEARHEVKRAVPDPTHSIELFGYMDKVSFEDGVRNMWEWVNRENKVAAWYEWNEFELDKGIYSYWKTK